MVPSASPMEGSAALTFKLLDIVLKHSNKPFHHQPYLTLSLTLPKFYKLYFYI